MRDLPMQDIGIEDILAVEACIAWLNGGRADASVCGSPDEANQRMTLWSKAYTP